MPMLMLMCEFKFITISTGIIIIQALINSEMVSSLIDLSFVIFKNTISTTLSELSTIIMIEDPEWNAQAERNRFVLNAIPFP